MVRNDSIRFAAFLLALGIAPAVAAQDVVPEPKDRQPPAKSYSSYAGKARIPLPTPRWTAFDAKRFGVKMGPEVPMTTQERAYTSPIGYTP